MTSVLETPAPPDARPIRRRSVLVAVGLATFMTYLDNNVINVAIPTIQRQLHLSESGIEWVVSAYILVFSGMLLAGGRLADVFGLRRLFTTGLTLFTVASLAAGLSGNVDLLVASRALQGLGAALLTPTTLAIISRTFPEPGEQARAVGAWSAVGALALALGPLLGGLLSQHSSWHWIFFINVPVGVVTLALGLSVIPAGDGGTRRSIDGTGVSLSAAALLGLTYGLIQGPQTGWTSIPVLASLAIAGAAGAAFVVAERRSPDPMVDVSLFSDRVFSGGVVALMAWAFGLFGIYFFTSLYMQDVLGLSPTGAGLAFVPMALVMAAGATVADRVASRIGAHRSVGLAMVLMAVGVGSVALLGARVSTAALMPSFVVIGLGGGLTIPLTSTILGLMPADRSGVASALFNASREVAGLLGITVIGVILTARQAAERAAGASPTTAFLGGYRLGLVVAAALIAVGGLVAWRSLRVASSEGPAVLPVAVEG